jgi:excisionase family DNA binding protein
VSTAADTRQPGRDQASLGAGKHPKGALNRQEAAEWLGVHIDTFKDHVLPSLRVCRIGRRVLIPVTELERWLDLNAAIYSGDER